MGMPNGPTGLPPLPDMLVRLSRSPVVSIVSIRGRATGVGSELSLACDMRFASREKAVLSQFEIGAGFVPGGGPMARFPRLVGRGRALEILLRATTSTANSPSAMATSIVRCRMPNWTSLWTPWPGASLPSTRNPSEKSSIW
jgi:enoyl-CoA hydratase/carnithine racemase